jgi:hypothetical protein
MNALTIALVSACAAFLSACIGAVVSYKVNEREIKAKIISASRQKWIDNIQELVAELMSYSLSVAILKQQIKRTDPVAAVATNPLLLDKIEHVELVKNKIALLLDPMKPDHRALHEAVDIAYQRVVSRDHFDIVDAFSGDAALITQRARHIVKSQWERVKRGD